MSLTLTGVRGTSIERAMNPYLYIDGAYLREYCGGGAGRWTLAERRWLPCKQISCLASAQSMPMKAAKSLPVA